MVHGDSMECFAVPSETYDRYDAVMVNPPFVRTELQSDVVRKAIRTHADFGVRGKLDTYLAFLVFSIRALRPGGFGCFVVPQSLLTSDKLKPVRDWISEQAWVRVIADLSAIRVFKASVYVVLLILEKKGDQEPTSPEVSIIRCQRDVGLALDDFLDGNWSRTPSHAIFRSNQESLNRQTWSVPLPEESQLLRKLEAMPRLNEFAVVRPGVITGGRRYFYFGRTRHSRRRGTNLRVAHAEYADRSLLPSLRKQASGCFILMLTASPSNRSEWRRSSLLLGIG